MHIQRFKNVIGRKTPAQTNNSYDVIILHAISNAPVRHVTIISGTPEVYYIISQTERGKVSDWHASGPEFHPHVRHILSWRLGHEKIVKAIFPVVSYWRKNVH